MQDWKTYKLGELGYLARGKSKHRPRDASFLYGGEYPFIQTGDIKEANHKLYKYTQTYSEEGLKQSKLWDTGTICITIAANIADTAILTFPACFPDSVIGFIPDTKKCDVNYVEYLLRHYKKNIQSHSIGSVQENINLGTFERIEFAIPPIHLQQRIAEILSSLDDKVELNRQMNQTLEEMAQTMFKHYFVDGIDKDNLPEGWKVEKLDTYVNTITGYSYKSTELMESNEALVTLKNFDRNGGLRIDGFKEFIGAYKESQKVNDGDLVVAHTDLTQNAEVIGNPLFVANPHGYSQLVISTDLVKVNLTTEYLNKIYLYYLMRQRDFKNHCLGYVNGTTVLHLSKSAIKEYVAIIPPTVYMKECTDKLNNILMLQHANTIENLTLQSTRDYLLPKLISGEVIPAELTQLEKAL